MKKEMIFALAALFFLSMSALNSVNAGGKDKNKFIEICEEKADVTGDGIEDKVTIKGLPYDEGTEFLKEIQLEIAASNNKQYKIEADGGFEPRAKFLDLNHDGVKDIFLTVNTGGSGAITNHYLYSLKDFNLIDLTVPDPLIINSQFLDGYKASITIEQTGESLTFNLEDRAKDYEQMGLYQNGKLSEPAELMVDPYSVLKPIKVNGDQYGLKGIQAISGAYHADGIAYVESTWFYEKGNWTLKGTKVVLAKPYKK